MATTSEEYRPEERFVHDTAPPLRGPQPVRTPVTPFPQERVTQERMTQERMTQEQARAAPTPIDVLAQSAVRVQGLQGGIVVIYTGEKDGFFSSNCDLETVIRILKLTKRSLQAQRTSSDVTV